MTRARRTARHVGASALLVALSACASAAGGRTAAPRALGDPHVHVDARLLAMADARRPDLSLLDSLLAAPAETPLAQARRARATLLIGQLFVRERYAVARRLLVDADTAVAASAAFALGLARDTTSLEALDHAVGGAPETVAAEAAWALGRVGEPSRGALVSALRSELAEPRRGAAASTSLLLAAAALRPVPIDDVVPFLRHANADVVFAAAYAIARPRVVGGARALLDLRTHSDAMVRTQVALAAAYNMAGDSLTSVALPILEALLSDPDFRVRVQAVRSYASYAATRDVQGALRARLQDSIVAVRVTAAEALGPVFNTDSAAWNAAFAGDTTYMVQRALLDDAVRRGQLLSVLREWQSAPDEWRRVAALELSAQAPNAAAPLERSAWARSDRAPRVRASAVSALSSVSELPAMRDTLRAYARDASPQVQAAALGALAARATAADVSMALERYTSESMAGSHAVRASALRVITMAWRRDSAAFTPDVIAALRALTPPPDPLVRRSVLGVTPVAAWQVVPVQTAADTLAYRRVASQWMSAPNGTHRLTLRTVRGDITIELFAQDAPLTVENFVRLARAQYYNGTRFHRVIANFVAQDGDPTGTGSGGPGTSVRDELNRHRYARGAVGMALSGPDTGGSQYYLTLTPQPHLDGGYTVFGRVVDGLDVMDQLLLGDRIVGVVTP